MRSRRRYPTTGNRLDKALLSLAPTALVGPDGAPLRDLLNTWNATVTGSPVSGAAPAPLGRGITFSGSGQYATTGTGIPNANGRMSVLVIFATTNATAASRTIAARGGSSQWSWMMTLTSGHALQFSPLQSSATAHAAATSAGTVNDGAVHVGTGTFDGTTVTCHLDQATPVTSTSLTGSWYTSSTAGMAIAHRNGGNLLPGIVYRVLYWHDRILTAAEHRHITAIVAGVS